MPTLLETLHEQIRSCQLCPLASTRTHAVPGEGPLRPHIMLIGEAPGKNEDVQGKPFVGAAGKILDSLLEGAGVKREDVFITSICKCRPPDNRVPTPLEGTTCTSNYLSKQIDILQPKVIGLMGKTAIKYLLGEEINLQKMHGQPIKRNDQTFVVLYHPAAMIYNQKLKETMIDDFSKMKEW